MTDEAISPREILQAAAKTTGAEEELAALLEIDVTELQAWLHGTRPAPFGTCIHALTILERHRQPSAQEQCGVLSVGATAGTPAGGSLERFVQLAGMTSLVFAVGLCLLGLMTLSSFTKLLVRRHERRAPSAVEHG